MLFVIDKPQLQRVLAIVRDDRTKVSQRLLSAPFMRLEAKDDYLRLDGLDVSATIPATVYEPGVLFLKVTAFRRILQTIKGQKFVTIQVMADGLFVDRVCLPLEENDMLLYPDPDQASTYHPSVLLIEPKPEVKSQDQQLTFWNETETKSEGKFDQ